MQIGNFNLPTIWKQVQGYPNYEVSICGQVRNVKTNRTLKPWIYDGYRLVKLCKNNNKETLKIHRLVALNFIPNIENCKCIDHIDNNRFNNTISNLRWCSNQQNCYNLSLRKSNTSGIKGISWNKVLQKWKVYISFNSKRIHLGYFVNIDDAKNARQSKAKELFGEFLNECEK